MRTVPAAVLTMGVAWCGTAWTEGPPPQPMAEEAAGAHRRNARATEALLHGKTSRSTGVPVAAARRADGSPRVTYAVAAGPTRVQARIAKGAEAMAAKIVPGEPLAPVCTGAADGMVSPYVTGCRPAEP